MILKQFESSGFFSSSKENRHDEWIFSIYVGIIKSKILSIEIDNRMQQNNKLDIINIWYSKHSST